MALPEHTRKLVQTLLDAFCEERVPAHVRERIILSFAFTGNRVTLYEERAILWSPPKSSQSDPKSKEWQLYFMHRDERWHEYIGTLPTPSFMSLLSEVDADPTCIFWG